MRLSVFLALLVLATSSVAFAAETVVNTGATGAVTQGDWCPSTAVTTLPAPSATVATGTAKHLGGRKNITFFNPTSTSDCFLSFDPLVAPTTTGVASIPLPKSTTTPLGFNVTYEAAKTIRAICSSAMTTPNCIRVFQAR
jgi:hypothetical protein